MRSDGQVMPPIIAVPSCLLAVIPLAYAGIRLCRYVVIPNPAAFQAGVRDLLLHLVSFGHPFARH